jgi:hypothetical protein
MIVSNIPPADKMPLTPAGGTLMSAEWTEFFAVFEQSLNEWLARAVEPPSTHAPCQTEPAVLRQFEDRLKRLQSYLDKAEQDAEQALAPLTTDIQALQQWLDSLKTVRAKQIPIDFSANSKDPVGD